MMQSSMFALLTAAGVLVLTPSARAQDASKAGKDAAAVSEVVVTAPRQEVKARELQKAAPNLIVVQSAESIAQYPDFNAAESLGRLPGVSLSTDTGEGRFINIRGIDGNLDGATFGGVPMLNTNPGGTYFGAGGRAVEFDTIPIGSVDGIIVTYTGLPDHDAEGLGGSVELTPRTASNITRPFFEGALGWGYEPAHDHTGPLNVDVAVGARFGFDGGRLVVEGRGEKLAPRAGFFSNPTPFSFVLTGSLRSDRRGFDDMEEDYNNAGTADRSYQDLQFRRYDYHRDRFGYGAEFDFKPNDDHRYYLRANIAGYTESVKKNRFELNFKPYLPATPVGTGYSSPADLSVASTDEQERHRNDVYVVGGQDRFDETVLDYRASYSRATYDVLKNYGGDFADPTAAVIYDNSGNNGDFPIINIGGVNPNDASLYTLSDGTISNSQEHDVDEEYAYAANLLFPVHFINDGGRIKVGFQVRLRNKSASPFVDSITVGPVNLASVSSAAITDFYDGRYTNGPNVNTVQLRAIAAAGAASGGFDPSGYFSARENIYAGYGQYTTTIGPWGLLAGVRVEATDAKYGAFSDNNSSETFQPVSRTENYANAFPTVQLRYEFNPNFIVRATYSTGIGRPGFLQNTAATSSNHDPSDLQITNGNPALKPTTGDNFDVSFEYYLPRGGIVQFGIFDKEFKNYIVDEQVKTVYAGPDSALVGDQVTFTTFANVSTAYARGIEGAYHQQFQWLPKPFDGFGVEGNLTLVDSRIKEYDAATSATGHDEFGPLPGTSRVTANLAGFYEANRIKARLSGQYISPELFSLSGAGGSKLNDTIQDKRLTLDLAASYDVTANWQVYFNAKNLTNEPLRFYKGDSSFPIQREFYDVTYEAGVHAKF